MDNDAVYIFYGEHKNKIWLMTLRQFLRHKMVVLGMVIMAVKILMVLLSIRSFPAIRKHWT